MNTKLRRYGPVVFWLYAWFLIVAAPLALLTYWIAGRSPMGWWYGCGLVLIALLGWLAIGRGIIRVLTGNGPRGLRLPRALRLHEDMGGLVAFGYGYSSVSVFSGLNLASEGYFVFSLTTLPISWHLMMLLAWLAWWYNVIRPSAESGPRTDPGPGLTRARFVPEESTGGVVSVSVAPEKELTLAEAVNEAARLQFLPALRGGTRVWTVLVDDVAVGSLTQTWEHPKHWPPAELYVDPDVAFTGRRVSFGLVDPTSDESLSGDSA